MNDPGVRRLILFGALLRLEGTAIPTRTITADVIAMGTSEGAGNFRIERDPFTAPADCTVDVNDGSAAPETVTLVRCTVSQASSHSASRQAPTRGVRWSRTQDREEA